jgi:phospholipid/cholesterol/gamma-HCH transport system permease protein
VIAFIFKLIPLLQIWIFEYEMAEAIAIKKFLDEAGAISRFTALFFRQWFRPRYEISEFARQCFVIGPVKAAPCLK